MTRTLVRIAIILAIAPRVGNAQVGTGGLTLQLGPPTASIGSENSEGPTLFGQIQNVALDQNGRVYVLDVSDNTVRIFDRTGTFVSVLGRSGRGPGDFSSPWAVVHDGRDGLFVSDNVLGVTIFRTNAAGATLARVIGAAQRPRAVCSLGEALFLGGVADDQLVHELSRSGDVLRSFGESFSDDTVPAFRAMANKEPVILACDPSSRRVVIAQARSAKVRSYASDERLQWEITLPDYVGMRYLRDGRTGGAAMVLGSNFTQSVHLLNSDVLLVQATKLVRIRADPQRGTRARFENGEMTSYLIDVRTGRVLSTSTSLPIIHAVRGNLIVTGQVDPYPQIKIRPFTLRP